MGSHCPHCSNGSGRASVWFPRTGTPKHPSIHWMYLLILTWMDPSNGTCCAPSRTPAVELCAPAQDNHCSPLFTQSGSSDTAQCSALPIPFYISIAYSRRAITSPAAATVVPEFALYSYSRHRPWPIPNSLVAGPDQRSSLYVNAQRLSHTELPDRC